MRGNEVYRGTVSKIDAEGVFVQIPQRVQGYDYGPIEVATHDRLAQGDRVIIAFVNGSDYDVVVLGKIRSLPAVEGFDLHEQHVGPGTFDADSSHTAPHSH